MRLDTRQRECRLNYAWRKAQYEAGRVFPDPRNAEQRDLGYELRWHVRILRNQMKRAAAKRERQIAAARDEAQRRWNGQTADIVPIRGAR